MERRPFGHHRTFYFEACPRGVISLLGSRLKELGHPSKEYSRHLLQSTRSNYLCSNCVLDMGIRYGDQAGQYIKNLYLTEIRQLNRQLQTVLVSHLKEFRTNSIIEKGNIDP
ncbi:hypothetical protein CEXT_115011 [Caerostris extrusa]|uniref:Uncharacterized protein n=1 Tax=Caerostris extrusa TaxID=172846 RepID=A0AAV4QKA9_CAEEX|nr:hypothetical protein CEXT_115011 [Caerostris extrusa]